jgi:undecaprenyl pyrophosphate synthase
MRKNQFIPRNKIVWSEEMESFLIHNYQTKTNLELANHLGLKLTSVRHRLYQLGCRRMEMEYWTNEQIEFLKLNYQQKGDTEIAEHFATIYPKKKGWDKRHIEKKRRYLGLKRDQETILKIHQKNVKDGRFSLCPVKAWNTRGIPVVGVSVVWESNGIRVPHVKTETGYRKLAHVNYEKACGPIKPKHLVVHLDGDTLNCEPSNLKMISKAENALRNNTNIELKDSYILGILRLDEATKQEIKQHHPELINLKRNQLLLNRKINETRRNQNQA